MRIFKKWSVYLGHVISHTGVKPNPETINVILNFSPLKNQKDIKSFFGSTSYYRRFIADFESLTKLLKKDSDFIWSNERNLVFQLFKEILTSDPILRYPDFSKEFILTINASDFALEAVLSFKER